MYSIRKASEHDISIISDMYEELLTYERDHGGTSNWKLDVYPTRSTAQAAVQADEMYVLEEEGKIRASMRMNQDQAPEYRDVDWSYEAKDGEVLVIHTLCVPPSQAHRGYGSKLVDFAKRTAEKMDCRVIRIDTYQYNEPAKSLYIKNGFRIAGYGRILLAGLIDEDQVYLEYELEYCSGILHKVNTV